MSLGAEMLRAARDMGRLVLHAPTLFLASKTILGIGLAIVALVWLLAAGKPFGLVATGTSTARRVEAGDAAVL